MFLLFLLYHYDFLPLFFERGKVIKYLWCSESLRYYHGTHHYVRTFIRPKFGLLSDKQTAKKIRSWGWQYLLREPFLLLSLNKFRVNSWALQAEGAWNLAQPAENANLGLKSGRPPYGILIPAPLGSGKWKKFLYFKQMQRLVIWIVYLIQENCLNYIYLVITTLLLTWYQITRERLLKGDAPVKDKAAQFHDMSYAIFKDTNDRHVFDKKLQDEAFNIGS